MITFGKFQRDLTHATQTGCECDACGSRTLRVHTRVQWLQAAWLPSLPTGIKFTVRCGNCGASPQPPQMSAEGRMYFRAQRRRALFRFISLYAVFPCFMAALAVFTVWMIFRSS